MVRILSFLSSILLEACFSLTLPWIYAILLNFVYPCNLIRIFFEINMYVHKKRKHRWNGYHREMKYLYCRSLILNLGQFCPSVGIWQYLVIRVGECCWHPTKSYLVQNVAVLWLGNLTIDWTIQSLISYISGLLCYINDRCVPIWLTLAYQCIF